MSGINEQQAVNAGAKKCVRKSLLTRVNPSRLHNMRPIGLLTPVEALSAATTHAGSTPYTADFRSIEIFDTTTNGVSGSRAHVVCDRTKVGSSRIDGNSLG
jgi:hypothetical protein